jgi:LmbE family N-acetylglucosaminyl deacetylase
MSSDPRAAVKRVLFGSLESLWGAGHVAASMFGTREPRTWMARGGQRILVVAPHPDDETVGAGGVAALHAQAGDAVTILIVTDGRAARAGGLAPEEMARRRHEEVLRAAGALGVNDVIWLGLPQTDWSDTQLAAALAPLACAADIVYAPSCVDFHPDHHRVARTIAHVAKPESIVRIMELAVPLTASLVNLIARIERVAARKAQALAAFETQRGNLAAVARLARYRARRWRCRAAEVFWEIDALRYARVTEALTDERTRVFRGIRPRPFLDPVCFFAGASERRRVARIAEQR